MSAEIYYRRGFGFCDMNNLERRRALILPSKGKEFPCLKKFMKKIYEKPKIEIINLSEEDIMTMSTSLNTSVFTSGNKVNYIEY